MTSGRLLTTIRCIQPGGNPKWATIVIIVFQTFFKMYLTHVVGKLNNVGCSNE